MGIDDQRTQTLVLRIARCALCEGEHTILYEDDREPSLLTALAADTADDHGSRTNSSNTRFRGMNVEPERYPSKLLGQ